MTTNWSKNLVGQKTAIERIQYQLDATEREEDVKSIFVTGRTGLGKSAMTKAIMSGFKDRNWVTYSFACPTQAVGKTYNRLIEDINTPGLKVAIHFGECHRLKGRVALKRLHNFIMLWTDKTKVGTVASINDGEISALVDWSRLVFVLDTNFPSKLEEGKESTSFIDRFLHVKLDDYSYDHIVEILHLMLSHNKLRIHDNTIKLIADTARGAARPLENIVGELSAMAGSLDKETLAREEVLRAMKLAKCYPIGLTAEEVICLSNCQSPKRKNVIESLLPNLETKAIGKSLAYLQCNNFLAQRSSGYQTTPRGAKYLKDAAKAGFDIPSYEGEEASK